MTDITSKYLEAAILDQVVAGEFDGKVYAFVAVVNRGCYRLGVAVANEQGYSPIDGKTFATFAEAREWADGLNEHIGVDLDAYLDIVASTMGGARLAIR